MSFLFSSPSSPAVSSAVALTGYRGFPGQYVPWRHKVPPVVGKDGIPLARDAALAHLASLKALSLSHPMGRGGSGRSGKSKGKKGGERTLTAPTQTRAYTMQTGPPHQGLPRYRVNTFDAVRSVTFPAYITAAAAAQGAQIGFSLATIGIYSDLTAVFDEYRIARIEVWFQPTVNSTSSSGMKAIAFGVDRDGGATPSVLGDVQQLENSVTCTDNQGCYLNWIPKAAVYANDGSGITQVCPEVSPWCDAASVNITHYGISWYSPALTASPTQVYDMTLRYHVEFREVH